MRYIYGFICVMALGVMPVTGCSDLGVACANVDNVYDCIDESLCTPVVDGEVYSHCSSITEEECLSRLESPADGPGFCKQLRDGTSVWVSVTFCEEDVDCPEGHVCRWWATALGMRKGECGPACIDECERDADCQEGQSCIGDIACGGYSVVTYFGTWDEMALFCSN
jgi:hypothetical protein